MTWFKKVNQFSFGVIWDITSSESICTFSLMVMMVLDGTCCDISGLDMVIWWSENKIHRIVKHNEWKTAVCLLLLSRHKKIKKIKTRHTLKHIVETSYLKKSISWIRTNLDIISPYLKFTQFQTNPVQGRLIVSALSWTLRVAML